MVETVGKPLADIVEETSIFLRPNKMMKKNHIRIHPQPTRLGFGMVRSLDSLTKLKMEKAIQLVVMLGLLQSVTGASHSRHGLRQEKADTTLCHPTIPKARHSIRETSLNILFTFTCCVSLLDNYCTHDFSVFCPCSQSSSFLPFCPTCMPHLPPTTPHT